MNQVSEASLPATAALGSADMAAIRMALTAPGALMEIHEEEVRGQRMSVFRHRRRSLGALIEETARFGGDPYVIDGDRRVSYAENLELARRLGHALQARYGVRPGDRVAIFSANRWEWVVTFWAILALGAVPCLYNGYWAPEEFQHANDLVEPVLVLGDGPRLARVASVNACPAISFDANSGGDFAELLAGAGSSLERFADADEDDLAMLIFTSGTTGFPKAVMLPHRSFVGSVQLSVAMELTAQIMMGGRVLQAGEVPEIRQEVQLVTAPLFHVAMMIAAVLMSLPAGSAMVLLRGRFDEENALRAVERERVTQWSMLGSVATRVASSPLLGKYDTSSLRRLGLGGSSVSPAVQQSVRAALSRSGEAPLGMGYSSTEAGSATIASAGGPDFIDHPTSTGAVTMTTQLELRDVEGRVVAEGEQGEVHIRSPYVMLGYWKNPEATAQALKPGGWLAMGDIAKLVEGRLYIDSRARDMILINAENVSPTEVEYALEAHPEIMEAAVFAVDDAVTGDAVCAVVVPTAGSAVDVAALTEWCAAKLAGYKVPTRWYLTDQALPRTPSGKLLKREIRARIEAG